MKESLFHAKIKEEVRKNIVDDKSMWETQNVLMSLFASSTVMTFELNGDPDKSDKAFKEHVKKQLATFVTCAQKLWDVRKEET